MNKKRKLDYMGKKYIIDKNCKYYRILIVYLSTLQNNDECEIIDWAGEKDYKYAFNLTDNQIIKFNDININVSHVEKGTHKSGGYSTAPTIQKELCLTINCDSPDEVMNKLLETAKEMCSIKSEQESINVYNYDSKGDYWCFTCKKDKRDMKTLFLKENVSKNLFEDIDDFFESKSLYKKHGVPYKRNYLFEGIPGTGKTSLISVIASHFNMDVYVITFSPNMTDDKLNYAINSYMKKVKEERNLIVIEDIDSLFTNRKATSDNKTFMSFSGLLNCLDGVSVRTEQLIIMTTNHVNRLDPALLRPGRVDYHINFDFMDYFQIKNMYDSYFKLDDASEKHDKLFNKFYKNVEHKQLTPALLQGFFFSLLRKNKTSKLIDVSKNIGQLNESIKFTQKEDKSQTKFNMYN